MVICATMADYPIPDLSPVIPAKAGISIVNKLPTKFG